MVTDMPEIGAHPVVDVKSATVVVTASTTCNTLPDGSRLAATAPTVEPVIVPETERFPPTAALPVTVPPSCWVNVIVLVVVPVTAKLFILSLYAVFQLVLLFAMLEAHALTVDTAIPASG